MIQDFDRHMILYGILIVFSFFGASCHAAPAQNQPDYLRRKFAEEAPKAWEKYKARASRLQGTMIFKHFRLNPKRQLETDRKYEFKQKPGHVLFVEQDFRTPLDRLQEGIMRVTNPDYAFELRRPNPDRSWVLTHITRRSGKSLPFRDPADNLEQWITYPITFSSLCDPLRIVIRDPGYKATDFTAVELDGQEYVKVHFSYSGNDENPRIPSIQGYAIYDSDMYWISREYNAKMGWAARKDIAVSTVVKMEYQVSSDGFPIPKRVLQKYDSRSAKKEYHGDWMYEFELVEGDVPDNVFTLSAYGLPEPKGNLKRRRFWVLDSAAAGLACLAIALLIWRLKRIGHAKAQSE